jgi:hypothetical protein
MGIVDHVSGSKASFSRSLLSHLRSPRASLFVCSLIFQGQLYTLNWPSVAALLQKLPEEIQGRSSSCVERSSQAGCQRVTALSKAHSPDRKQLVHSSVLVIIASSPDVRLHHAGIERRLHKDRSRRQGRAMPPPHGTPIAPRTV